MGQVESNVKNKTTLQAGLKSALFAAARPDSIDCRLQSVRDAIIGNTVVKTSIKTEQNRMFETAMTHYKEKVAKFKNKSKSKEHHEKLMVIILDMRRDRFDVDGGSYRRIFISDYFHRCAGDPDMFIGRNRRLVPEYNRTKIEDGSFVALGIAIVQSVVNEDCGFPYLHPAVVNYMAGKSYTEHLRVDDIPDPADWELAKEISNAKSQEDLDKVVLDATTIDNIGWPRGKAFKIENRDCLLQHLTTWSTIDKRKSAIDELRSGLDYMGFLGAIIERDPCLIDYILTSDNTACDAAYINTVLMPPLEKLEAKTEPQKKAKEFCIKAVSEISDDDAKHLFYFITGLYDPPICQEKIQVEFMDSTARKDHKIPETQACFRQLFIPTANDSYEEFKESFEHALLQCKSETT